MLTLLVNKTAFIGNEADFSFNWRIVVDTSNNNSDIDEANNEVAVSFGLESESDINVDV